MSPRRSAVQFWDTSALVALIFREPHTAKALEAKEQAQRYLAWNWLQIEAHAALARRGATQEHLRYLRTLLNPFQYIAVDADDHPAIIKLLEKHRLRAADAGHLFCLKQAKKLLSDIQFVCLDDELTHAAEAERIRVFGG